MTLFSKGTGYALRALIFLAEHRDDGPVSAVEIADSAGISHPTLSKTLNRLSLGEIVASQSGPHGGFWLSKEPREITLEMVMDLFETQSSSRECLLGHNECPGPQYCKLHLLWMRPQEHINRFLRETTLADFTPNITGLMWPGEDIE